MEEITGAEFDTAIHIGPTEEPMTIEEIAEVLDGEVVFPEGEAVEDET
jgi:hypothetical protein